MNKIKEATFFFYSSLKKDRREVFKTDEGGPEKQFFMWPKACCIIYARKIEKNENWWVFYQIFKSLLLNFQFHQIQSVLFPCPLCILMIIQVIPKWVTIIEAAHNHISEQRRLKQACGLVHTQYERCNQP